LRSSQTHPNYPLNTNGERWLAATTETYTNTAKIALDAFQALIADARAGRQIKG